MIGEFGDRTSVMLANGKLKVLKGALKEKECKAEFIREAVDRELSRRSKLAARRKK